MPEWVSIRVRKKTRERLKTLGRKGESYDDVIQRLIEASEGCIDAQRKKGSA